ncbi:unnamed protein product [Cylindrotheca closterium]|uniref:Spindle pole body component n=1 Tax=Cylindrotheca closterium TaxID=2856 RepID=A0AAD2G9V6_9STRA|nr:unnamed protein product [Cylindrotheca closterium]
MSGAAALARRRDNSAAKAALARRRQRAAQTLLPNNSSSNAPGSSMPPLPKKPTASTSINTSTSTSTNTNTIPVNKQRVRSSPLRGFQSTSTASDPAGSFQYLSPNKPSREQQPNPKSSSSLNAVARNNATNNRQSKPSPTNVQQRDRMHSNGTATTASMTVGSTTAAAAAAPRMTPPSINRTSRPATTIQQQQQQQQQQQRGSSPLRSMPSRSPQTVIHYTTQQKEKAATAPMSKQRMAPSPIDTSNNTNTNIYTAVEAATSTPSNAYTRLATRTSSAALNARLKARYQSPSHKQQGRESPPATTAAAAANNNNAVNTAPVKSTNEGVAAAKETLPPSKANHHHRPPPPAVTTNNNNNKTMLKGQTRQSSHYVRPLAKPPVALNKHVVRKPTPTPTPAMKTSSGTTSKSSANANIGNNLTINTTPATTTTATTMTSTSRTLAASPRRSAVRDRMHSNSSNEDNDEAMTPSAANTTRSALKQPRMPPTPSNIIPVNNHNNNNNNNNDNNTTGKTATSRSTISPRRQEQMSQRLAQRAIDANRPNGTKPNANANANVNIQANRNVQSQQQAKPPPRVSPPKEFGSISTFLMNDTSILDTSNNNLLDTTLPPVETPTPSNGGGSGGRFASSKNASKNMSKNNAAAAASAVALNNKSILLEDFHQQPVATSGSSTSWNLDASCLTHHSGIMLRSCATNTTIQREKDLTEDQVDDSAVDCRGLGLGKPEEALTIDKLDATTGCPELRHGDLIRILASSQHALGAYKNERYGLELLFLPIFASSDREDEEDTFWQVFVAEPGKKLLVGKAAVDSYKTNHHHPSTKLGLPVRAGVPILLRHVTTGGVLSMSHHGSLTLLTDSFGQSQAQESLDQLQHHDKLLPCKSQTFQFIPFSSPPCPPWAVAGDGETSSCVGERLFMTSSYLLHPKRREAEFESQIELSPQDRMEMTSKVREKIIIEEVIGSFLGLEGRHIRMKQQQKGGAASPSFGFHLSGTDGIDFEMSLHHLVEQILPMSTSYNRVQHFVTSHHPGYDHGRVMQAFCEGLDTLLQDYVDFVVQLERQHRNNSGSDSLLTMKNIFFQITPTLHSMSILEHATRAVRDTKGGALINALWSLERQVYMGDMVAKKVLGILLENASIPYLDMMAEWLESGRLNDPYKEFMVQQSSSEFDATQFDGDDWMAMFSIDEDNILEGVTSDEWTKERIMTTGKYWNAVHACQVDVGAFLDGNSQKIPKLPFNSDSSAIVAYIDSMYQSASRVLVLLMKEKFMLTESMDVMKRYFLLDQGDFVMNFLDVAEDELRKKASEVSVGRVQNWLNASIQQSEQHRRTGDGEEEKRPLVPQALRCRFSGKSTIAYLESRYGTLADRMPSTPSRTAYGESSSGNSGIEVFVIDFSFIPFPISLVLSHHAMDKYKLLFRHLLFTKHVERRLIRVWRDHQILKKLGALRGLLGPTFLLRQQMLHFVQNFLYYMSFEVIENNWTEMMTAIEANETIDNRQQTVDDILQVHEAFLERTLEACLLTNRDLVRSLTKLLNTVLLFTDQMKRFMDATRIYDDSSILAAEKQLTVQRNLNERRITPGRGKKKTIHMELMSTKKERQALNDRQTRRVGREVISESFQRMVGRFGEVFNADLSDFMKELNQYTASGLVANLGVRLDYNGYVTSTIK